MLRRSIRELCVADHGHDEAVLAAWLANKTPAKVSSWITSPSSFSVVATEGFEVQGFGLIRRDGEALEEQAARWGLGGVFLTSSVTAKRFYERNGYLQSGEPTSVYGLRSVYPMSKSLPQSSG